MSELLQDFWDTGILRRSQRLRVALDYMRWIAATMVLLSHTRSLYFTPRSEVTGIGLPLEVFYYVSRMGEEAVVLFFVMSGFLIGGKFLSAENRDPAGFRSYMIARSTRLALVAFPVVVASYAILRLGLTGRGGACASQLTFVGNLLFLQDIVVPPLCDNTPLWSLANEYWYYLLFPLMVFGFSARNRAPWLIALFLALVFLLWFDSFDDRMILLYFPLWMVGILGWCKRIPIWPRWLTISGLALAMLFARSPLLEVVFWAKDYAIGIAAVFVLRSFSGEGAVPDIVRRFGIFMASFSFSLYLVHYPLLLALRPVVAAAGLSPGHLDPRSPSSFLAYFLLDSLALCAGYLLSLLTERRTDTVRKWLTHGRFVRPSRFGHPPASS